ncbi:Myb/SANT-like transcription factor [Oryctes borbonicus]|uniref:Myb/SANT-like transcription factor n=1 Tax=Oryctes borbonicus TaxID=1629725 RepID=A0A0T6B882_9SCAR|nr:Myb/SANT-like transcription factor [Oryctes borbonicus]
MRGAHCRTEVKAERRANIRSKRANVGCLFTQLAHIRAIILLVKMNCAALISEVYSRKPLWDSTHPQHHNRTVLDRLWEEVSQIMEFSVRDVRKKWKYLRDQYRKELKKVPKSEDGTWTYQPSWSYFHSLEFLTPEMSFDEVSGSTPQNTVTNSNLSEVSRGTEDDEEEEILPDSPLNSSEAVQETSKNRAPKRKAPPSNNEFNEKLLKLEEKKLELLTKQQIFIDEERSDDYHFFMSLLPVMQKFNDLQRFRIRSRFQSIIIEEISKMETCEHTDTKIFGLEN